uniref:NB-ARC domain-containing disease resistance protein n=1 Tax=Citrus limon TaxID=2708 RepID=A0A1S8ADF9_CITLI
MSIVGETILTVTIEMLVEKLISDVIQLFARQEQIQAALKDWKKKLGMIRAVLDDAVEQQTTKQSVKTWLGGLESLAYDVEDKLDEFAAEALRRKFVFEPADLVQPRAGYLRKLIPTCCTKFSPQNVRFDSKMAARIEEITSRFQDIVAQKDLLDLKENSGRKSNKLSSRPETTSLVIEAEVQGREEEKKAIVELLLKDDLSSAGRFSVIPIVGMGGLGKTALAQLVYNDPTVESHFDFKAWVCVSEDFDAVRVTRAILKSIHAKPDADDNLNFLQVKLRDGLSGKKFFLVLDDMWNENYSDWTNLRLPFVAGAAGNKIIVTTRSQNIASMMGTGSTGFKLKKLTNQDCLRVFAQHSLGTTGFSQHQQLQEIGEEIAKKCCGLPLAAKTLGGLLRGKNSPHDWLKVLNNKIWDLSEEGDDIMRALKIRVRRRWRSQATIIFKSCWQGRSSNNQPRIHQNLSCMTSLMILHNGLQDKRILEWRIRWMVISDRCFPKIFVIFRTTSARTIILKGLSSSLLLKIYEPFY